MTTWSKWNMTWQVVVPQPKSPLSQIWYLQFLWKWRYNVSILSRNTTWPNDQRKIWHGKWNPLNLSLHHTKNDAYRSCEGGDITFLFCHMTSRDHMIKGTCDLADVDPSSHQYVKFDDYRSCGKSIITFLFYHVALFDHMITKCDLVNGGTST